MATRVKGLEAFVEDQRYESEYRLSKSGIYNIVPAFLHARGAQRPDLPGPGPGPRGDLGSPGGGETRLPQGFRIPDPFVIPFTASYTYVGPATRDGADVRVIKVSYTIFHRPAEPLIHDGVFPTQIAGWSEQTLALGPPAGRAPFLRGAVPVRPGAIQRNHRRIPRQGRLPHAGSPAPG
ncbi:MAG: hypothetical protein M0C28_25690 [Candidatus Moduliflexus flocculans]|nr:hypothetical protein [Candidatus Moduliflexus flocculans]